MDSAGVKPTNMRGGEGGGLEHLFIRIVIVILSEFLLLKDSRKNLILISMIKQIRISIRSLNFFKFKGTVKGK